MKVYIKNARSLPLTQQVSVLQLKCSNYKSDVPLTVLVKYVSLFYLSYRSDTDEILFCYYKCI